MSRFISAMFAALVCASAWAQTDPNTKIDLRMVPIVETAVGVGTEFEVAIVMSAKAPQRYVVSDIIFGWDQNTIRFAGISHEGSHPSIWVPTSGLPCPPDAVECSGFPDFYGINEAIPPADGNGLYFGFGQLGEVFIVDAEPVQIVRLKFVAIAPFTATEVRFIPQLTVNVPEKTVVYGSYIPGLDVTGTMVNCTVVGTGILGDIDGNGLVDSADLSIILASWSQVSAAGNPADLNGDGEIGSEDLAILLANWS